MSDFIFFFSFAPGIEGGERLTGAWQYYRLN